MEIWMKLVTKPINYKADAIVTDYAPTAIGPYSQAIRIGSFVFTSGQIPIDPATGNLVGGGIVEQTTQVFANIEAVLAASGVGFREVVKTTVYMKDLRDFAAMNDVYARCFSTKGGAHLHGRLFRWQHYRKTRCLRSSVSPL